MGEPPAGGNGGGRTDLTTEEQVRQALRSVNDPEIGKPIEDLGMLKEIRIAGSIVEVDVLLTIEGCPLRETINNDVTAAVSVLEGVEEVRVSLTPMSEEERGKLTSQLRGGAPGPQTFFTEGDTAVIAVASG